MKQILISDLNVGDKFFLPEKTYYGEYQVQSKKAGVIIFYDTHTRQMYFGDEKMYGFINVNTNQNEKI